MRSKKSSFWASLLVIISLAFIACQKSFDEQKARVSFCIDSAAAQGILALADAANSAKNHSSENQVKGARVARSDFEKAKISVSLKGDYNETQEKTLTLDGVNFTFKSIPTGSKITVYAKVFYINSEGQAQEICSGQSEEKTILEGDNQIDISLKVTIDAEKDPEEPKEPENPDNPDEPDNPDNPEEPENPDTPEDPENPDNPEIPEVKTAKYKITYLLQNIEGDTFEDYTTESSEIAEGTVGETTKVQAAPDKYKGFHAIDIEQQKIKEDNSTEIKVYYQRNVHSVIYDDGVEDQKIKVPETKTKRYGATVLLVFDNIGEREGNTFEGWSDGVNTYKQRNNASITISDSDVTLTAVWEEIPIEVTYTAENVAQQIAALNRNASIKVTGAISNQTISDINVALKTLYAKNTTGQTDKCIKVILDLSETTGLTEIEETLEWNEAAKKGFYNCYCLKEIVLPNTVESIGAYAFYNCSNLGKINLPESITSMGNGALRACSNLESIVLPSKVTEISEFLLANCESLSSVEIKGAVTKVKRGAFAQCSSLVSIQLPDTIEEMGGDDYGYSGVFAEYTSLKQVNIPNKITYLPHGIFAGCTALESVEIPENITGIGYRSFVGCTSLKSLSLPSGVDSLGISAFANCESLESINIPAGITRIMKGTFSGCSSLQSITIPASVNDIEDYAFSGCASITTITIPDGIETLPIGCFKDCTKLKTIEIPDSVTTYLCDGTGGGGTFQNCSSLEEITIPAGSTGIGRGLFSGCSSLKTITIPETVTGISHGAFYGCSGLTQIDIPASVTSIGQGAFGSCENLQTVTFHESSHELEIDAMAFANCTSLKSITLPKNTKNCYEAFTGCTALETVVLPSTYTYISFEMFYNCSSLKTITIPDTVKEISQYAFRNCTSLQTVNISKDSVLEKIGEGAFYDCEKLSTIYVPDTVTEIHSNAFKNCTALTQIEIPGAASYGSAFDSSTKVVIRQKTGDATFDVELETQEYQNITVQKTSANGGYTFTAETGFDTYKWKWDGVVQAATSNTFETPLAQAGTYTVTLIATKTVAGKTQYYSYTTQVTIE